MDILTYSYPAAKFTHSNIYDIFKDELSKAEKVKIASGYISSASLIELKKAIEINKRPYIELLIGMHYFDGFTSNQWQASTQLHNFLIDNELGCVYISKGVKFHGKVYSFFQKNSYSSIVGSSNLSSILDTLQKIYEFDLYFKETEFCEKINATLHNIIEKFGEPLNNISEPKIIQSQNVLLENYGIEKVNDLELVKHKELLTNITFEILLKTEPKSNLNVFFGKGRENQRGYILPRPWYEIEIIVSSSITAKDHFPRGPFYVITDDGWKFKCKTSGDYFKNFRSENDLKILGRWIKGRLENMGILKVGEKITDDILRTYGRNTLSLTKTKDPDMWYLDFKPF